LNIMLVALAAVGQFLCGSVVGALTSVSQVVLQQLSQQVVQKILESLVQKLLENVEKYNDLLLEIDLECLQCTNDEGGNHFVWGDPESGQLVPAKMDEDGNKKAYGDKIYTITPIIKLGDTFKVLSQTKEGEVLDANDFVSTMKLKASIHLKVGKPSGCMAHLACLFQFFPFISPVPAVGITITESSIEFVAGGMSCDLRQALCGGTNLEDEVKAAMSSFATNAVSSPENRSKKAAKDEENRWLVEGVPPMQCCSKKAAKEEGTAFLKGVLADWAKEQWAENKGALAAAIEPLAALAPNADTPPLAAPPVDDVCMSMSLDDGAAEIKRLEQQLARTGEERVMSEERTELQRLILMKQGKYDLKLRQKNSSV